MMGKEIGNAHLLGQVATTVVIPGKIGFTRQFEEHYQLIAASTSLSLDR